MQTPEQLIVTNFMETRPPDVSAVTTKIRMTVKSRSPDNWWHWNVFAGQWLPARFPWHDISAAYEVEAKIRSDGLEELYSDYLAAICQVNCHELNDAKVTSEKPATHMLFNVIHATPLQRMQALVAVLNEKGTVELGESGSGRR